MCRSILPKPPMTALAAAYALIWRSRRFPSSLRQGSAYPFSSRPRVALDEVRIPEQVEAAIRRRVADAFSFANRGLVRPAYRSELIALLQGTPGVTYVDLEAFGGISDAELLDAAVFESIIHHLKQQ